LPDPTVAGGERISPARVPPIEEEDRVKDSRNRLIAAVTFVMLTGTMVEKKVMEMVGERQ